MKFNSYSSLPKTVPSPPGEEIYIWEYLTEDGEIVEQRKDVYAEIQSYENTTRYKELIENGVSFSDDSRGVYADVSELANNSDYLGTVSAYISQLVNELNKVAAVQQVKTGSNADGKSAKIAKETAETAEKGGQINEVNG